ncbi:MAG: UDP-N-acetylmuramoyl-L-alanine--D-glutamate ligase, partial [Candidatus Peribacteraceae bacterium]
MHIKDLNGKKVCILGFGQEGQAVLRAIAKYAPNTKITIADKKSEARSSKSETVSDFDIRISDFVAGEDYLQNLDQFDIIIKSPGIPPCPELTAVGIHVTNTTQIFLDTIAGSGATVIGVTGSKGKSTTASLIHAILAMAKKDVHLVGNIGDPAIDHLEDITNHTIFVMEMSSYQLLHTTTSPHIAVIVSFFPEHLDYHQSMEAYREAKRNIVRFQKAEDIVIFNAQAPDVLEIAGASPGVKVPFTEDDAPVTLKETHLIGAHNLFNIAAASKTAESLQIDQKIIKKAICAFKGLPHRLQNLGKHHGITWVDDSISTTPESAIAALEALGADVATMLLGGQDRGNDFAKLGEHIAKSNVKHVILFPPSGVRIQQAIQRAQATVQCHAVTNMKEAVSIAREVTPQGKTCLLSPASPSYGLF